MQRGLVLGLAVAGVLLCWRAGAQDYSGDVIVHWSGEGLDFENAGGPQLDLIVRTGTRWPGRLECVGRSEVVVGDLSYEDMCRLREATEQARLERCSGDVWTWEPTSNLSTLSLPSCGIGPVMVRLGGGTGAAYDIPGVYFPMGAREREEALGCNRVIRVLKDLLNRASHAPTRPNVSLLPCDMPAPALVVQPETLTVRCGQPLSVKLLLTNRGQRAFRFRPSALRWTTFGRRPPEPVGGASSARPATQERAAPTAGGDFLSLQPGEVVEFRGTVEHDSPGKWTLTVHARAQTVNGYGWLQDPPWIAGQIETLNEPKVTVLANEGG